MIEFPDAATTQPAAAPPPPQEFDPALARIPAPVAEDMPPVTPPAASRGRTVLLASVAALILVAIGLDIADLVARATAASPWLGVATAGLAALAAGALAVLGVGEALALIRLRRIDALRRAAEQLRAGSGDPRGHLERVRRLYAGRVDLAPALATLAEAVSAGHDDIEIPDLIDRHLLADIDRRAYRLVLTAARDTAAATALTPSATLDALVVLWRNLRLVRQIATLFGGRPGLIGSARLLRRMLAGIAVAGAAETGHHVLVQALGGGLAASLSTRVGQGLVNGLLTARVGLAAMHLCRPQPYQAADRPNLARIRRALAEVPSQVL